jgi:hypothetical protein
MKIHPQRMEQFLHNVTVQYEEEHFTRRGYDENEIGWQLSAYENEYDMDNRDDADFYGQYYTGKPTPPVAVPANNNLHGIDTTTIWSHRKKRCP